LEREKKSTKLSIDYGWSDGGFSHNLTSYSEMANLFGYSKINEYSFVYALNPPGITCQPGLTNLDGKK
jgi:hypothetical protein